MPSGTGPFTFRGLPIVILLHVRLCVNLGSSYTDIYLVRICRPWKRYAIVYVKYTKSYQLLGHHVVSLIAPPQQTPSLSAGPRNIHSLSGCLNISSRTNARCSSLVGCMHHPPLSIQAVGTDVSNYPSQPRAPAIGCMHAGYVKAFASLRLASLHTQ